MAINVAELGDDSRPTSLPVSHSGHEFLNSTIGGNARAHFGDIHIHEGSTTTNSLQEAKRYETILASLRFERMGSRLSNIATPQPNTCEWIFRQDQFVSWIDPYRVQDHHNFLWIKGKPGCGKSTLMKKILTWAGQKWPGSLNLSFFFNARAAQMLEKSCLGMYRSLVAQMVSSCPQLSALFLFHFSSKEYQNSVSEWTERELQEFLIDLVLRKAVDSFNIFIDALDEGDENDVRDMISFLEDLAERAISSDVLIRVLFSSRHYPHIHIKKGLSFGVEDQAAHGDDIRHYVKTKLADVDSQETNGIQDYVCRKSLGIFPWVEIVVKMLNRIFDQGYGLAAMKERLENIPEGLENLFSDILAKDPGDLEDCATLLQWMLYSKQPLTAEQLYIAFSYSHSSSEMEEIQVPDQARLAKYILNCSRGLVELTFGPPRVVQFIHETVRDFLIRRGGLVQVQPFLSRNVRGLSYDKLKGCCLRYVRKHAGCVSIAVNQYNDTPEIMKAVQEQMNGLLWLNYTVQNLLTLAEDAEANGVSQRDFITILYNDERKVFTTWMLCWNIFRCQDSLAKQDSTHRFLKSTTILYMIAEQSLTNLARLILEKPIDVDARSGNFGHALQVAGYVGSIEVTELLLKKGVDLENVSGRYGTALQAASIAGHTEVMQMLVDHGFDVNKVAGPYGTSLQAAAARGHKDAVLLLLKLGAGVNIRSGMHGSALHAASALGHKEVVIALLDQGASVNASIASAFYTTALRAAKDRQRYEVVRILLDHGAIEK